MIDVVLFMLSVKEEMRKKEEKKARLMIVLENWNSRLSLVLLWQKD